ncbi:T9SS type A sorting domain-containing protein, partial [Candidatus Poribacteria bacterium]|nr:T9SS type A sorting domain-containing protein [Candidatus Poribacteria bacterium]
ELATDTDVRITIYAANGVVVRTLQLGQQSAGYYTDREHAAYWDGRNASGEQVASGVYFYQLETDEISSLRKMVILK